MYSTSANGRNQSQGNRKSILIDVHNLSNRGWKVVLSQLETIEYRNLYQTRHTFITAVLETPITMPDGTTRLLDAKDVAKLVGNSPETIYRHYAGASRPLAWVGTHE
jgi:integrase